MSLWLIAANSSFFALMMSVRCLSNPRFVIISSFELNWSAESQSNYFRFTPAAIITSPKYSSALPVGCRRGSKPSICSRVSSYDCLCPDCANESCAMTSQCSKQVRIANGNLPSLATGRKMPPPPPPRDPSNIPLRIPPPPISSIRAASPTVTFFMDVQVSWQVVKNILFKNIETSVWPEN